MSEVIGIAILWMLYGALYNSGAHPKVLFDLIESFPVLKFRYWVVGFGWAMLFVAIWPWVFAKDIYREWLIRHEAKKRRLW